MYNVPYIRTVARRSYRVPDPVSYRQYRTCGVPQVSILGPLLFLLYLNDLAHISDLLFTVMFADDTSMFASNTDPSILQNVFNSEL